MIPARVYFTGLEFEPSAVEDRWHRSVIPVSWNRVRFKIDTRDPIYRSPVNKLNRWLYSNIEGKWSVWIRYSGSSVREVNIAFERETDEMVFKLADAKIEAFKV